MKKLTVGFSVFAIVATSGLNLFGVPCQTEDGLWKGSEWLSVSEAELANYPSGVSTHTNDRASDGTSWFRADFRNAKAVKKAVWTTTALGVYEIYVNGRTVGSDFLKPGFTHVKKTRRSFAYDVTSLMKTGAGETNRFDAEVSSGWWRDKIVSFHGKKSAFRGVLEVEYTDGETARFVTNPSDWRAAIAGPVTHAAIFDGETYDARISPETAKFSVPEINREFKGEILPSEGAEVTLRRDLAMKKGPYSLKAGEQLVIDFGQNCAAVPEFVFSAKAGTVLSCLPGEMLNDADKGVRGCDGPKGTVYRANLRTPRTCMRADYTFRGDAKETYHPRFTFFGYRYVQLSADGDVEIESITSIPVTSIKKEMELGRIETGDSSLNRFIANVYWGQLSNYLSIPTDCPQRNERLGWTADTQVFVDAGAYNADTRSFFHKWTRDLRDTCSPLGSYPGVAPHAQYCSDDFMRFGWSDAGVIAPWKIWRQFGDRRIVDENWEAMEKYMAHVNETQFRNEAILKENRNYQWADWLSWERLESCDGGGRPSHWGFVKRLVPKPETVLYWDYLGGCYWALDARMMREMAAATDRPEAVAKYTAMENAAKAYLRGRFFDTPDGTITNVFADMQTPAVFALAVGFLEGEAKAKTIAALRANLEANGNLTGFLGCSILMDTLSANGMDDVAVKLMLNHRFPSWLYSVDQGATTIWERWNGWTKEKGFGPVGMNSYNHYAYGSVLAWIYRSLAGIAPDSAAPGFKTIVMKPIFDRRLGYVKAEYKSAAGLITSHWRYEGDKVVWDFSVPAGSTALVTLPGESKSRTFGPGSHQLKVKD